MRDADQKQIDVYQGLEQKQHGLRSAYGEAMATPNRTRTNDPETGKPVTMTDGLRAVYKNKYDEATAQVQRLQDSQRKIVTRNGGQVSQSSAPLASSAPPAQQAPAAPAKAQQQIPTQAPPAQGTAGPPSGSGQVRITAPDGSKHVFPNQAAADKFKKLAGIQ